MIRIVATKRPLSEMYEIGCRFHCELFRGLIPSIFLLDTGADKTTIIAERYNIDITTLERSSNALTAAGVTPTYAVRDAIIVFTTTADIPHPEYLDSVDVISLPDAPFHGILGMDILGRFRWKRDKYTWVLEK